MMEVKRPSETSVLTRGTSITSEKTVFFISTAVKISNLTNTNFVLLFIILSIPFTNTITHQRKKQGSRTLTVIKGEECRKEMRRKMWECKERRNREKEERETELSRYSQGKKQRFVP
jgi:hypothetical protein